MNKHQLKQIADSIKEIPSFQSGYPKRIIPADPKWQEYFDWQYALCLARKKQIENRLL